MYYLFLYIYILSSGIFQPAMFDFWRVIVFAEQLVGTEIVISIPHK